MTKIGKFPKRGEIFWVSLDPAQGNEIQKKRPALVISNDLGNEHTNTVIVAPITSSVTRVYPHVEVLVTIDGKQGKILLQQCRAVDKSRLGKKIMTVDYPLMINVEKAIKAVFNLA